MEEETLVQMLEECLANMCDNYCKFQAQYQDNGEDFLIDDESPCNECPLNKIM